MKYFIPDAALIAAGFTVESRAIGITTNIPAVVNFIVTGGYTICGDNGGGLFKKVLGPLADNASFQSADGSWWQIFGSNLNVNMFGAVGDGLADDTSAINDAITFVGDNGQINGVPDCVYYCGETINFNTNRTVFDLQRSKLLYDIPTLILITISGIDCQLINGVIDAPAVFDGTNEPLTYGIIQITNNGSIIERMTLNNVPKCGIWFNEANEGKIINNIIDGGTPSDFFNGNNTGHFGIGINPASTDPQGNFIISGNFISRCVQGCSSGNIGSASYEQSYTVTGNVFTNCWNHGYYCAGLGNGHTISVNAFNGCQTPIAVTGSNHVVTGNTLVVQTNGTGIPTDNEITGISLRDPVCCNVSDNSIKGEGTVAGAVIGFEDLILVSGNDRVEGNICSNNTVEITNADVAGVTIIRMYSDGGNPVINNIIEGNVIKGPMRDQDGMIEILDGAGVGYNNVIRNNIIIITGSRGNSAGILCSGCVNSDISGNTISLEFDALTPLTLSGILLDNGKYCSANNNKIFCSALWGANITIRGIQEATAATGNRVLNNSIFFDPTKLVASVPVMLFGTTVLDHTDLGTPEATIVAAPGSRWWRTDGGAGTTLYVKESGASNVGWVGK